jgi:iron-sulfur cluster assembly 1
MATPRFATPLASSSSRLFRCAFASSATPALRPCRHILRRVSEAQSAHMSTKRKMQTSTYHPYSLEPHAPPPPRSIGTPETSIGRGIPQLHDTRPPPIPEHQAAPQELDISRADVAVTEKEAQKTKPVPSNNTTAAPAATATQEKSKPRSRLRAARKAAIRLTPLAVQQLRNLLSQPEPKLIKVGVKNRGCSGLSYNLEYVDKPGAFDEMVEQDGVKVLIDSKALFSIIGSEMDYVEDKLSERFVFQNPNISKQLLLK